MNIKLSIIIPDRIFFKGEADEIILPTNTGQMGVLTGHTALITALDIGVVLVRFNQIWTSVILMGGFALIQDDNLTILANAAESAHSINLEEAQKDLEEARQQLNLAQNQKQKVSAQFFFKRAQARFQVVK